MIFAFAIVWQTLLLQLVSAELADAEAVPISTALLWRRLLAYPGFLSKADPETYRQESAWSFEHHPVLTHAKLLPISPLPQEASVSPSPGVVRQEPLRELFAYPGWASLDKDQQNSIVSPATSDLSKKTNSAFCSFTMTNMNFDKLKGDGNMVTAISHALKTALASEADAGVSPEDIELVYSAGKDGSVDVIGQIHSRHIGTVEHRLNQTTTAESTLRDQLDLVQLSTVATGDVNIINWRAAWIHPDDQDLWWWQSLGQQLWQWLQSDGFFFGIPNWIFWSLLLPCCCLASCLAIPICCCRSTTKGGKRAVNFCEASSDSSSEEEKPQPAPCPDPGHDEYVGLISGRRRCDEGPPMDLITIMSDGIHVHQLQHTPAPGVPIYRA